MRSNSGPAKRASQGAAATRRRARPRATAARRSASASAPRAAQGHRRLRLAPPHAPHPEAPRSPPGASHATPRRTGPGLTADRRSVGDTPPYARRPRPPCYGGISRRHRNVTGGVAPIKLSHTLLAPPPPLLRARHCRSPVNSPPRPSPVRPTFLAYSLGALEACAATRCSALHIPCWNTPLLIRN
jgi:hypothetical protein